MADFKSFQTLLCVVAIGAVLAGIGIAQRRYQLANLYVRQGEMQLRLRELERRRFALRDERDRLLNDPRAIERVARDNYGFAAPGEQSNIVWLPPRYRPAQRPPLPDTFWDQVFGWGGFPLLIPVVVVGVSLIALAVLSSTDRACENEQDYAEISASGEECDSERRAA
jgi:hypothetical protein